VVPVIYNCRLWCGCKFDGVSTLFDTGARFVHSEGEACEFSSCSSACFSGWELTEAVQPRVGMLCSWDLTRLATAGTVGGSKLFWAPACGKLRGAHEAVLRWSKPVLIVRVVRPNVVLLANPESGVTVCRAHVGQIMRYIQ
jgi:hypothetical protein